MARRLHYDLDMKKHSSLFMFVLGATVFACTAAPTGTVPGGEDDKQESNNTSLPPSNSKPSTPSNGSTPTNPTPSDPAATDASTPIPTTDGGTTPTPTPTTDPAMCAASADFGACIDCCDQANPGGFDVSDQAWGDCVCQAPGVCAQACGNNFCAGGQPSFQCEQCLDNNTQQCDQAADAACAANAACAAAMACFTGSQCEQKP